MLIKLIRLISIYCYYFRYRQLTEKGQRSLEGNSPIMGINCGLYISGRVKVGDSVYVYNSEN